MLLWLTFRLRCIRQFAESCVRNAIDSDAPTYPSHVLPLPMLARSSCRRKCSQRFVMLSPVPLVTFCGPVQRCVRYEWPECWGLQRPLRSVRVLADLRPTNGLRLVGTASFEQVDERRGFRSIRLHRSLSSWNSTVVGSRRANEQWQCDPAAIRIAF